jgi:hypothetical protein
MAMKKGVATTLGIMAGLSAIATFAYFSYFDILTGGERGSPLARSAAALSLILLCSAPILLLAAVKWPEVPLVVAASIHAAIFFSLLAITTMTFRQGHSSLGDSLAPVILTVLWLILAAEFVMIFIALNRAPNVDPRAACLSAFAGLTVPLIGGWMLGVIAWSVMLPAKVIASAEATAGSKLYCVEVDGRPVDSKHNLVAWAMLAQNRGGYTHNFHALMVIGSGPDRTYANWSYRLGRFAPIAEKSRVALHLDQKVKCEPIEHFLVKL